MMMNRKELPEEIKEVVRLIEQKARRARLDFPLVIFELVNEQEMNGLAATGGFPLRWSHWIHGQEFERMKKFYRYGISIIYEMVINTAPAYAYLLNSNSLTDHKMVIAHVYGHCDFFKNNVWLSHFNPKMADEIADHAIRVDKYKEEKGQEAVEKLIDDGLSILDLIDLHAPHIRRERKERDPVPKEPKRVQIPEGKGYLEEYLNPVEWLEKEREELKKREELERAIEQGLKIPVEPTRDVVGFLIQYAPLEQWQRDLLAILREENCYVAPQGQTKIMNEGWASYWQSKMMIELGLAESKEIVDYAARSAGTWAEYPGAINPYKLGLELWRDIEWRWDTGRHGPVYENCPFQEILENWDEFVVLRALYRKPLWERQWDEWCAFQEALSRGEFGFSKEVWDKKKAVKWWCEYQDLETILSRLENQKSELTEKIERAGQALAGFEADVQNSAWVRQICESDLEDVKADIAFYGSFAAFRKAFNEMKVRFKRRVIPENYLLYLDQSKGEKLEIGTGLEKMFEVRTFYNDINFISEFFTDEFCKRHQYYTYAPGTGGVPRDHYAVVSTDARQVRDKILFMLTNLGKPIIYVSNANHQGRGELYLDHVHEGMDLRLDYMKAVLEILYRYWQKKVHLETTVTQEERKSDPYEWLRKDIVQDPYARTEEEQKRILKGERRIFSYDGIRHEERKIAEVKVQRPFMT